MPFKRFNQVRKRPKLTLHSILNEAKQIAAGRLVLLQSRKHAQWRQSCDPIVGISFLVHNVGFPASENMAKSGARSNVSRFSTLASIFVLKSSRAVRTRTVLLQSRTEYHAWQSRYSVSAQVVGMMDCDRSLYQTTNAHVEIKGRLQK